MMASLPLRPPRPPAGLVALLAVFEYKPGWRFEIRCDEWRPDDPWALLITIDDQLDARDPGGRRIRLLHQRPIPCYLPDEPDRWLRFLRDAIAAADAHERDEWFVVNGERPFDPHRARR
jgi:hypothetical protein